MSAERFIKVPVEVEAMQFKGGPESATQIIDWVLSHGGTARYSEAFMAREVHPEEHVQVDLPGSVTQVVDAGAWLIRGNFANRYVACTDEYFRKYYDAKSKAIRYFKLEEN